MADPKPDVVGKGPALLREALATFAEVSAKTSSDKIKSTLASKSAEIEPLVTKAYVKTVKGCETAYLCKELADQMKASVDNGDEAKALEAVDKVAKEIDELVHKIKTFVIRMT